MSKIKKLTMLLSIPSLDGTVALAAMKGMFTLNNVLLIALLFISGPIALMTASSLDGIARERVIVALISGLIATTLIVLAAGFGPKVLGFVNLNVLRTFGGIAILLVGMLILGLKIPDKVPLIVMIMGLVMGVIWR